MKCRLIIYFITLYVFSNSNYFYAQTSSDTTIINKELTQIEKLLERDVDSAGIIAKQVIKQIAQSTYYKGVSKAYLYLSRYYTLKGKVDSSLIYLPVSIRAAINTKDTALIVNSYLFHARNLATSSKYEKAISQALIAQKLAENQKNTKLTIKVFHDLGFIHSAMNLHHKSILYFEKGLGISKASNDTFNYANLSARLGGEFHYIGQYDSSLFYNQQGLSYFKMINHKRGIGASMVNLVSSYSALGQIDKAIEVSFEAIKLRKELGDDYAVTMLKLNLTDCFYEKRDYQTALELAKECEVLAKQQNESELILQNYTSLKKIYYQLGKNELAYQYAEKYINYRDSIFTASNFKTMHELQAKYESEKNEREINFLQAENKAKELQAESERKTRNYIIGSISIIALLIALFTVILFKRFKITQKQKTIIEQQKEFVDEKNREITDSINYALTIQQAVIPHESDLKQGVKNAIVVFKPKDIVSGDFYWYSKITQYIYYVVGDCTGHGVPGAFMSLMGINYLSEIINEKKVTETDAILNELREKVIHNLNKSTSVSQKRDGMDLVLIRINTQTKDIQFSGANNSIYILQNQQLKEIKGDKMPIGLHSGEEKPFTKKEISLTNGDRLIAFTDGLPDQFGGPKGKKMMYKTVERFIIENNQKPLEELKVVVENAFHNWKGDLGQIDDITFLGIEI